MVKIQFLGHSAFKISAANKNILIDPFFCCQPKDPDLKRLINCPVKEETIGPVDVILITHEHFDHFDKEAVQRIALQNNSIVAAHETILDELNLPRNQKQAVAVNKKCLLRGITIQPVQAHHPQSFYPLGFVVGANGATVYHAGDTELLDDFSEIKADIALLPIGGKITMDCVDAVKAVKSLKPKYAIPMHYNTFKLIQQDPMEFKQKIEKSILRTKPIVLMPGKSVKL